MDLKTHQVCETFADAVGFGAEVNAEKRFDGDAAGETRHFVRDVADFALPPPRGVRQRVLDHRGGVFVDARFLKRGLRQTPLTPPEISFAIEQAIAEQAAGGDFRESALVEFVLLDHENLFDQVRMTDEKTGLSERERKINQVTIFARASGEKIEALLAKFKSDADERLSSRTRRTI